MKKSALSFVSILCLISLASTTYSQNREVVVVKRKSSRNIVYVNPTPRVRVVRVVPPGAQVIRYRNTSLYFHSGLYYNLVGGRYVIIAPPRGIRVTILPPNHFYFKISGRPYYYFEGTYYSKKDTGFEVVNPPLGAIVPNLPEEAEKISIEGKIYYEYDKTIYKTVETKEGLQYEVAGEK